MPLTPDDHDLLQRAEADVRRLRESISEMQQHADGAARALANLNLPLAQRVHVDVALSHLQTIIHGARAATPQRAPRRQERRHDAERRR